MSTNFKNPKNIILDEVLDMLHSHREAHDSIYEDYLEGDSKMLDAIMKEDKSFTEKIQALEEDDSIESVLEEIGEDDMLSFLNDKGYCFIKLESLADKMKLEDFIKAEIYPHHNDENKYTL